MSRFVFTLVSLLVLSGCAVVDLAAHGVKQYEKSKQPQQSQPQTAAAQQAEPVPAATAISEDEAQYNAPAAPPPASGAIRAQSLD